MLSLSRRAGDTRLIASLRRNTRRNTCSNVHRPDSIRGHPTAFSLHAWKSNSERGIKPADWKACSRQGLPKCNRDSVTTFNSLWFARSLGVIRHPIASQARNMNGTYVYCACAMRLSVFRLLDKDNWPGCDRVATERWSKRDQDAIVPGWKRGGNAIKTRSLFPCTKRCSSTDRAWFRSVLRVRTQEQSSRDTMLLSEIRKLSPEVSSFPRGDPFDGLSR